MIWSRPYDPKVQGKIEWSRTELRTKIYYTMVNLKDKGLNWVYNIPNYMTVLNELHME